MNYRKIHLVAMAAMINFGAAGISNAAVPHTFTSGSAAVAAEVNANFTNLDQRVGSLEGASLTNTVAVDCSADATALKNMTLTPNTTYVLTGMCDGQIAVGAGMGTVNIQGDATGTLDDGITLPAGETDNDTVFATIYGTDGVRLNLSNLVISAVSYIGSSDLNIETIASYRGAHVTLNSVNVLGGDIGVSAGNTGTFSIEDNVNVTGFREAGLNAYRNGLVRVFNAVTVTGGTNLEGDYSEALVTVSGGIIDVGNGTFTAGTGPAAEFEAIAVGAYQNSTIRVRGGTLSGIVYSGENSYVRLDNVTHSGGSLDVFRGGNMRIEGGSVSGASGDEIWSGGMSVLRFNNVTIGNVSGTATMSTYRYGVLELRGTTNMNGRTITCPDAQGIQVLGTVTNAGAIGC